MALRVPVLLLASCLALGLFHASRGLYESTEGRYAECAREMARSGSWLEPVLNGKPHWTKPPLTYLAIRVPCSVLGPTTWAARLYLIPCFLLSVWAVGWMAFRMWRDRDTARLSAMVYATMGFPLFASQSVSTDFPLAAAVAVAQAAFWEAFRTRSKGAVYLTWLLFGVAFLIKGPPALLYLPAMIATWLRIPKSERPSPGFFSPAAILLFLAVSVSWYAWEAGHHAGLMTYWLKDEVVERSLSDKFRRHPEFYMNFVVYLPILLFGHLPWSGFLVGRFKQAWAVVREAAWVRGRSVWSGLTDEALWLAWSVLFPLAVFALSKSKLPLYVLPVFAALAVGLGRLLMALLKGRPWFRTAVLATWAATSVVFVVGKFAYAHYPSRRDMGQLHRALVEQAGVRDPSRLVVLDKKDMNGLSYYYDTLVPQLMPEELAAWAASWAGSGKEHFVVTERFLFDTIKEKLAGRTVEERLTLGRWRVYRVTEKAGADADKKEAGHG